MAQQPHPQYDFGYQQVEPFRSEECGIGSSGA